MTYKKFMSLFLIAGSIASTLCSCAATDSSAVVGYIDEHPITMEEFNYFLSQQKSSVCQSYSQLYGITSFDSAFWNNEYGDSTPLDSARASAKEACLEAYATQMLAEKTTSAEFLSFSQLKENAENFNTARKESTSNGGIVYGPIEYSFDSYYHRYLSQLENDIKEYWISTNAVSDADIDAFYSENQNLFSLNGDADVSAIYLSYIPSDLSADNIFLGLEEGVSLEDIQTQLQTLQYQINPHFLFNTLNTLKWIATLNHVTPVSHGIDALSSLLQSTLIKKDELIPFDDELRNLKNYCDIQQLRYAGRFEMEYQIEDAAGYWTVPRFILQPLVENSILHGTADEDDFVTITVRATVSENLLTIHISDTGCGFDPSAIKEKNSERFSGIGLSNVDERMRLHYGNEYGLTIESAPGTGTQCILRIPNEAIR